MQSEGHHSQTTTTTGAARRSLLPGVRRVRARSAAIAVIAIAVLIGCAQVAHPRVDPAVNFAAHTERRGLVVDRVAGGQPEEVVVGNGGLFSKGPTFVLRSNGQTVAGLWVKDDDHLTVREGTDPTAPIVGRIETTWQDDALHLVLRPAAGPAFGTGVFHRIIGPPAPDVLSSRVTNAIDLDGAYAARIRDTDGHTVGWLRVQVDPPTGARRIYDGNVPAPLNGPMAVAAAALIDRDVDGIQDHALDVYRGN